MKALSGYAEWFWLMAKGWKDVENRDWSLFRYIKPSELPVRIYLHASKTPASHDEWNFISTILIKDIAKFDEFHQVDWHKYRGAIIGEITIIGQCDVEEVAAMEDQVQMLPILPVRRLSKWLFGRYGFWVKDGTLYDKPIPYKGQLGFFEVNLPEVI